MRYEIPDHPWFRENKFPNHSIENVENNKIVWFLDSFNQILNETSPLYKKAVAELATMITDHYQEVKRQYGQGSITAEGVPLRFHEETPLERAINTAWVMNCVFWPSNMCSPDDLVGLEYFAYTRLNYPNLYALFIEWAWG